MQTVQSTRLTTLLEYYPSLRRVSQKIRITSILGIPEHKVVENFFENKFLLWRYIFSYFDVPLSLMFNIWRSIFDALSVFRYCLVLLLSQMSLPSGSCFIVVHENFPYSFSITLSAHTPDLLAFAAFFF